MKYYCKNCKSEFTPGNEKLSLPPVNNPSVHCPFCEKKDCEFEIIPDYETPEQYEKRTGKPYPGSGGVWYREKDWEDDGGDVWTFAIYRFVNKKWKYDVVVANPPVPPPDNWRPQ